MCCQSALFHLVPRFRMHGAVPPFPKIPAWRHVQLSTEFFFLPSRLDRVLLNALALKEHFSITLNLRAKFFIFGLSVLTLRCAPKRRASGLQPPPHPQIEVKKKKFFVGTMILNILGDLSFSRNRPLKLAGDQCIKILKIYKNSGHLTWNQKPRIIDV